MADTTVTLGRLKFPTAFNDVKEQLGDGLDATGPVLVAGEGRARPFEVSLPVRGADRDRGRFGAGGRLRRQVRSLLENPIVRSHGLYLSVSFDSELAGWLMVGGGDIDEEQGGVTFADWKLTLSDCYRVGSSRTVRPARRAEIYDRRAASTPRDWLRRVYSTGFSGMGMLPLVWLPAGVSDVTSARGAVPPLGQTTTREGIAKVAIGLAHSEVASFELANPAAETGDAVAVDRRSQVGLVPFGHSYAAGYGLTPVTARWPEQYARGGHRGRITTDMCNSGAVISWSAGAQGWSYFLQTQWRVADPAVGETLQTFQCYEVGMGINDLAQHPDSDVGHGPILEAFRRVIVRARSAAVIEDNDASASYAGSWSNLAATDKNSGAGWHQSTGAGDVTVTIPATYAGTELFCCWVANKNATGTYEVRVDGALVWSGSIGGPPQGATIPIALGGITFTGVARTLGSFAPGTHTVKVTCTGVSGTAAYYPGFDCVEVMCAKPTPVAVQNVARPANYSMYAAQAYPPTDTVVQNFNARLKPVVEGEWDPTVGIVDTDTALGKNPALFQGDGLHPTEQGHALIARAHAQGRPVPVEEVPGPDYQLSQPSADCPSLDNGRVIVSYAGGGVWRVTGWDPTVNPSGGGWVEQAAFMVRRIGDATGLCTTAVSFAVAEASTERVVVEAVMRNNADGYSRERVFITLQRGWSAPRVEVYPAPEASGAQADASILVYSNLVDAATTVSKQDSGGVASVATAGTGGQFTTGTAIGAGTFTGENWVWMARHGRTFAIAAAVLQAGLGATCLYDGSAGFGGSRNGFMVSSGAGGAGYCGIHLGLSRQAPAPAIEAEAMTLDGTSTSQADGAASGGTCVKGTRTAVGAMATQASVVLPATYRVLIRARVDSGATGSFNVVHGISPSSVVTTTSTSWVWLDSGALAGNGTNTLVLNAWRSSGSGSVYVDRIEIIPVADAGNAWQATGRYDGARDHGQAALADTLGVPGLVARGT